MGIKENMHDLLESAQEHSATLCAIGAVAGVFVTAWLSGRAAVKVSRTIDPDMTRKDKAVLYCKTYAATAVSAGITTGLIVGSDRIHVGKEAVLAAGAAIWKKREMALNKKLVEEVGPDRAKEIIKEIKETEEKENCSSKQKRCSGKIPESSMTSKLYVYEPYSEQYFYTTRETIAWVMLEANRMLVQTGKVKLNAIVTMLGGEYCEDTSELGWFWDDENQNDDWMNYCGPWVEMYPDVYEHHGRDALCLFYTIEPQRDAFCNKLYREET